jgi:hypothetical protein
VERKARASKAASEATRLPKDDPRAVPEVQPDLVDASQPPDTMSARAKSTRHGKVTADHWNQ